MNKGGNGVSLRRRVFSVPTLVSFSVAFAFIIFLVTQFDLDWRASWSKLRSSNPWLYLLAFSLYYISFLARGWRWRILASNAGVHLGPGGRLPTTFQCALLIFQGWFVNAISWFRLGDAYRAYALAREAKGSLSRTFGTILAERVVDMATVFTLLLVGALLLSLGRGVEPSPLFLAIAFGMVVALALLLLVMRLYGRRLARLLPQRLQDAYSRFHEGTLGSLKQLPALFGLGLGGWLLEAARLYFVVQALDLDVGLAMVLFVALAHALLTTVPITPGGLGIVEPGIIGLLALSLARHDALSVALLDRSITYVSILVLGGLVFLLRQILAYRARERASLVAGASGQDLSRR